MPVTGRLAHNPDVGNVIGTQMHVEGRVKHIQPRPHHLDLANSASVNLDAAAASNKTHDRKLFLHGMIHHRFDGRPIDPPGKITSRETDRLMTIHAEILQKTDELMHIRKRAPAFPERVDIEAMCPP